jgi:HlyD family secretion protein
VSSAVSTPATESGTLVNAPKQPPSLRPFIILLAVVSIIGALVWYGTVLYRRAAVHSQSDVPTVKVQRGDVSLSIFARGEVRGGNSQLLTAPMTGSTELHILSMSANGAPVQAGDVVVRFDTTDQDYALREAESDLAEAEAHILQAAALLQADAEEDRYALSKAKTDVALAELDARKNPILPAITAKQNDLAVTVARDKLKELEQDLANRKATDQAGIAIQQAAEGKAEAKAATARQNIEAMTLKAQRSGYVSIKQNTNVNIMFSGMELPIFQVGDQARPGMAIAEIPDLSHWEAAANIGELDRGHLAKGDKVKMTVIALPNRVFHGHVTDIGSVSGSPWDRRFECKLAVDDPSPDLRPGMSIRVEITTETMKNVLWLPAQALFESDGKMYVYLRSGATFTRKDVTLVRRNETRVVLTGLQQGQEVALANPTEAAPKKARSGTSPLEALQK